MQQLRKGEMLRAQNLAKAGAAVLPSAADYDVTYYRMEATFRKDADDFGGNVTMRCTSKIQGLQTIELNFASAGTVDSVVTGGQKTGFVHNADVLSFSPPQPASSGESLEFRIYYSHPYANSAVTVQTVGNSDLGTATVSIATQAEPYGSRNWWPCKDDPSDKADSIDLVYTVDSDLFPVGNGVMLSDTDNGDETHTVHWKSNYPIATYLVSLAAAGYNTTQSTFTHGGKTMPVTSWYYTPPRSQMAFHDTSVQRGLRAYSDLFGTYPFIDEKYGMAEYEWGGAMEHQTVSSMGVFDVGVNVHELAHQWFGDKVTCKDFGHIWLNEGWATYCEALYYEAYNGVAAMRNNMRYKAYYGAGTIFVPNAETQPFSRIFSGSLSYNKGSWVVHMLRHVVGDSPFFRATKRYLGDAGRPNYRSVDTPEFQSYYEQESGMDLGPFFQQWIYGEYYPTYSFTWKDSLIGGKHEVKVDIQQMFIPQRQVFDMPIDLTFAFAGWDTTIVVRNNAEYATYTFSFDEKPASVQLDKNEWILKHVTQPISNPDFAETVLLVNGVDWDEAAYTEAIKANYADSVFTGNRPYVFWDLFANPSAGYPSNIVPAGGSAALPLSELQKFCTVVWVGNQYNGDEIFWNDSPMYEYLQSGGNVILVTRMARSFIDEQLRQYLSIGWTGSMFGSQIMNSKAQLPGFVDMTFTGEQTLVNIFDPVNVGANSSVLFTDDSQEPPVGVGVWAFPRIIDGQETGHFAYIGVRPYRVDPDALKHNMQTLLDSMRCGPLGVGSVGVPITGFELEQNYPNPVSLAAAQNVTIRFAVPGASHRNVRIEMTDVLGRTVASPVIASFEPGRHSVSLSPRNLTPGLYFYRLTSGTVQLTRKMIVQP